MSADKTALRARYQSTRSSLDASLRSTHDQQITTHVLNCCAQADSDRIAAYLAFQAEPDLTEALHELHRQGRTIVLPVVEESDLLFRAWTPDSSLRANRFGIAEPVDGEICEADQLDRVLMPLVAFDARGVRLGMGGGFYDRCFAFKNDTKARSPRMTGIAYSIQQHRGSEGLPFDAWDVRLDEVITESGLIEFG